MNESNKMMHAYVTLCTTTNPDPPSKHHLRRTDNEKVHVCGGHIFIFDLEAYGIVFPLGVFEEPFESELAPPVEFDAKGLGVKRA